MSLDADERRQARMDGSRSIAFKTAMISYARSERYLKQPIAIKLFELACNLKRIAYLGYSDTSFATRIQVCNYLIEWSAPELCPERAEEAERLVNITRGFARFRYDLNNSENIQTKRNELAAQAQSWSDEILEMSGLVNQE